MATANENKSFFKTNYKSERRKTRGSNELMWTPIMTNTDILARTDDTCEVQFQLYEFVEEGKYTKAGIFTTTYKEIRKAQVTG